MQSFVGLLKENNDINISSIYTGQFTFLFAFRARFWAEVNQSLWILAPPGADLARC